MIPVDRLLPNPENPRKSDLGDLRALEKSIRKRGLKQPLLVTPAPDKGGRDNVFYYIEDGWRRWLAMSEWNTEIPCIVIPPLAGMASAERFLLTALVTSVHRLDLTPVDRARAFGRLRDEFGMDQVRIAEEVGVSVSTVSNSLLLLELAPDTQERVSRGPEDKRPGTIQVQEAVKIVRRRRAIERRKKGGSGRAGAQWEPDWFTAKHPLAYKAASLCDRREHNSRRRLGAGHGYPGACGQCWQSLIETDYEQVLLASGWTRPAVNPG